MIDAYVINLEKDIQRKEALIKNIKEHNVNSRINFNFIKAIEEKTFNEYNFKICNTWFDTLLRTGITVGEVGCALSHYKCWNDFYNSKKEYAIIFEDDIQFTYDFNEKLTILINYPKNADIVYIHRKPLNQHGETKYDANFTNIKASYWTCGYLLTRSGVEKLLKTNFLDNLIVVDEFLPLLYDSHYLSDYKLYYNNIDLIGYSINNSFIKLVSDKFLESNTFHSNYYKYDNNFIVITSDLNTSLSSKKRFIYSCEKYSLNYLIINEVDSIFQYLHAVDDDKIIKEYSPYRRINHFKEWLNQLQAKETTEISDEIYLNEKHPENQTIKIDNLNNKFCKVKEKNKWITTTKDSAKEKIFSKPYFSRNKSISLQFVVPFNLFMAAHTIIRED